MKRLLVLLLVVVGLAAGACNVDPDAADVNGTIINQGTLNADLAAIDSSPGQACFLQITSGLTQLAGISLTGVSGGTYNTEFASAWLSRQIDTALVGQLAARRGHPVTASELMTARADVALIERENIDQAATAESEGGAPSSCTTTSINGSAENITPAQLQSAFPSSFTSEIVDQQAALEAGLASVAGDSVDPAAIAAYYHADDADFDDICVTVLGSATQAEATQFRTQALAGTSLAAIAGANPSDTGLQASQCYNVLTDPNSFQNLQETLKGIPVGSLSQPLADGSVWLLVRVDSAAPLPLAQVSSFIRNQLLNAPANQSRFESAFQVFGKSADISVDPRDGTWSVADGGLFPPVLPPAKDLLSPEADQPAVASSGLSVPGLSTGSGGSAGSGGTGG